MTLNISNDHNKENEIIGGKRKVTGANSITEQQNLMYFLKKR